MMSPENSENKHRRKTQRGETKRLIMETSVSSYEHSGGVSHEDKEKGLKTGILQDQQTGSSKVSKKDETAKAERHVPSPLPTMRAVIVYILGGRQGSCRRR